MMMFLQLNFHSSTLHFGIIRYTQPALHAALVQIDHCGLAVGIGVLHGFCVNDTCLVEKKTIDDDTRFQHNGVEKLMILFCEAFLSGVLLQDNKVAADLRSSVVRKEVVGPDVSPIPDRHSEASHGVPPRSAESCIPCEVMNATIPPSLVASNPLRKK